MIARLETRFEPSLMRVRGSSINALVHAITLYYLALRTSFDRPVIPIYDLVASHHNSQAPNWLSQTLGASHWLVGFPSFARQTLVSEQLKSVCYKVLNAYQILK